MRHRILFALLGLAALVVPNAIAVAGQAPPPGARVYFVNLKDGDEVKSPFTIQFGAEGVKVVPAAIQIPNTGHHHLIINTDLGEEDLGFAIPDDAMHRHFTSGQTEVTLNLRPGKYSFRLVFADGDHVPYDPWLRSEKIFITIVE